MARKNGPTLKEIGELAGVSKSTASRALRNDPRQSAETRKRIQEIAKKLGYKLDPLFSESMSIVRRQQSSKSRGVLAYVDASLNRRELKNNIRLFYGARKYGKTHGFEVQHLWFDRRVMSPARFETILESRGIRGILLAPLIEITESIAIPWERFPSVAYGFTLLTPALHCVSDDHTAAMHMALKKLREKGYRRIGFVTEELMEKKSRNEWISAFQHDLYTRPREERIPALQVGLRMVNEMQKWQRKFKPEAVICCGYPNRFFKELFEETSSPPFVTLEANLKERPHVSGILQGIQEVGAIGAELLIHQILHNEKGIPKHPKVVLNRPLWHEAATAPSILQ
ncbi:MAG: LacI family DNA-binding transcriptional regulator [Verrucomicrobiota bacterium]